MILMFHSARIIRSTPVWMAVRTYSHRTTLRILLGNTSTPGFVLNPDKRFTATSTPSPLPPQPPKRRRIARKLLLLFFATTVTVAGGLYTCEYLRHSLIHFYPDAGPILKRTEQMIGGWYTWKPKQDKQNSLGSNELPFFSKDERSPENQAAAMVSPEPFNECESKGTLPTIEEVVQMTKERTKLQSMQRIPDLRTAVSEASESVQAASRCLAHLECSTREQIEALREALKGADTPKDKERKWDKAARLLTIKEKAEEHAGEMISEAVRKLDSLHQAISEYKRGDAAFENDIVPNSIKKHGDLEYSLSGAVNKVRQLQNEVEMLMHYRDLVAATHESLQEDLSALRDQVDLKTSKGPPLSTDELNSLLSVAHARIIALQDRLLHTEVSEKSRLQSALEAQRRIDVKLIDECVKRELKRQQTEYELERYHWEVQARETAELEKRAAIARHSDHLSHMLRIKEEDMEHQFSYRIREALAQENTKFEAAVAGWTRRMQAIEDVVDGRAELDRIAKESQALWIACEALASMLSSTPSTATNNLHDTMQQGTDWADSLGDFVEAIKEAAASGSHPFALKIVECMPSDVVQSGVWLERGLAKRFDKLYKVCRRVALVDETSGSLWVYFLSWLQSFLLLDVFSHKYHHHLEKLPWFSPSLSTCANDALLLADSDVNTTDAKLAPDTFTLLRSAKAAMSMEHCPDSADETIGNSVPIAGGGDEGIELAVRLMGQLRGQARVVAEDWLTDARRYLEARQTAKVLLAYATARNISTYQKRL